MEEIISSILQAEAKAEEIIANASENAKNTIIWGENEADKIKEQAISSFKAERKTEIAKAEKLAEEKYSAKVAEGEKSAKELSDKASVKIDAESDKIVKIILGK